MLPGDSTEVAAAVEEAPDKRDKIGYWLKWLKGATTAAKRHWLDSRAAYKEYELPGPDGDVNRDDAPKRGYNIYAESCWTLEPAYYSRTPRTASKRRFGIEDEMALTMSLIADRLGQHNIDEGCFDDGMFGARGDFIHAAKGTTQVVYEAEKDALGNAIEDTQRIYLAPTLMDEIVHTPQAKTWSEITDIGYKFCLDYDEAEKKFNTGPDGQKLGKSLPYTTAKDYDDEEPKDAEGQNPGRQLEGWEIYCKTNKRVYWVSEKYKESFLTDPMPDPYGFKDFFPSPPFIIKNKRRKSLYPTPTWVYLEATANQLHNLYERIFVLISAVERKAIVHGASPELMNALNSLRSARYLNAADSADILEKGGINKMIEWVEVKELTGAISECLSLKQDFKDEFSQSFGIPDILRGVSDPEETAAAQAIKSDAGHDRFKTDKKMMVDLARNSAEMMLDLSLKVYSDDKIKRICGHEFMERGDPGTPPQPPTPENPEGTPGEPGRPSHYERFDEALFRLRNDQDRIVTLDFETDSTNFRDEGREIQKAQIISKTVQEGLGAIGNAQNPQFIPLALDMLLGVLDTMGGSTKLENMIRRVGADIEKIKNQPPPPTPPDPMEVKNQIAMQQQQIDQAIAGRQLQQKDLELQIKQQIAMGDQKLAEIETSLKQQIEGMQIALKDKEATISENKRIDQAQEAAANIQTKERELEVKAATLQKDTEIATLKLANERQINQMLIAIEQQKVDNDALRIQHEEVLSKLRVVESFMEEKRLTKQAHVDNAATMIDAASLLGQPEEG